MSSVSCRPVKNRFGSTAEIGIFEMACNGLREVTDPSELFIRRDRDPASGVSYRRHGRRTSGPS
ncbi:MAG: hypothetical protein MZV63_47855 [Marinilabiliales bacterium]|nr:hypothetical protein [Marinilabiliales bacterium]